MLTYIFSDGTCSGCLERRATERRTRRGGERNYKISVNEIFSVRMDRELECRKRSKKKSERKKVDGTLT